VVPTEATQILYADGTIAGRITSSRYSPTLNRSICLAQVDLSLSEPGTMLTIRQVDGTLVQAKVMSEMAAVDPEGARPDNDTVPEELTTFAEPIARGPGGLGARSEERRVGAGGRCRMGRCASAEQGWVRCESSGLRCV